MARVIFENGTVVNFDGAPSQADIDFVASQIGLSKKSSEKVEVKEGKSKGVLYKLFPGGGIAQGLTDFGVGALKGAASTVRGTAELGEKMLHGALKTALPKQLEKSFGVGGTAKELKTGAEQLIPESVVAPKNKAQKIGYTAEQIGEFLIPGAASKTVGTALGAKAASALGGTSKMAKAAGYATKLAGMGAAEGLISGGIKAAQIGEVGEEAIKSAKWGAATLPAVTVATDLGKAAFKVGRQILGVTTGTGKAVDEAFTNPNVIKYAREAGKDTAGLQDEVLDNLKTGVKALAKDRGDEYVKALSKIDTGKKLANVSDDIKITVNSLVDDFDLLPVTDDAGNVLKYSFDDSAIEEGSAVVNKAMKTAANWSDDTVGGLDRLKKKLWQFKGQLTSPDKAAAKNSSRVLNVLGEQNTL